MKFENLVVAAGNNFDEFGEYALSVFSEAGLTAREVHNKYIRHRKARVSKADRVRELGYEIKPTHEPGHYDIVLPNPPTAMDWENLSRIFDTRIERTKGD